MTTIHMETDEVRQVASLLNQKVDDLLDFESILNQAASRVSTAWYGGQRPTTYHKGFQNLLTTYKEQISRLETLSSSLAREVNEWEMVDKTTSWRPDGVVYSSREIPVAVSTIPISNNLKDNEEFNWFKWGTGIAGGAAKVLPALQKITYTDYEAFGKLINPTLGPLYRALAGDQRLSLVPRVSEFAHAIQNPALVAAMPFIGLGLGMISDVAAGDRWDQAIGSELFEAGIKFGIKKGLTRIIPGVGQALLVYDAVLGVGKLAAVGMDIIGLHEQAAWLQNTVNQLDVVDRFADSAYDFVANYVTNPDKILPDISKTWDAISSFGSGLFK